MHICNSLATALSLIISNFAITFLIQISSFFELIRFLSSCQKSQYDAQVASFPCDNAGKMKGASDTDPVDGKATSQTSRITRRFSNSGRKRSQNSLPWFYPSLPEAGVDNDPVVHQKKTLALI